MKNPFPRLRSWYTDNRKYDGFVAFVVFGFVTIAMLILNIMFDTSPLDWAIWIIWLQTVLYNAGSWQNDKHMAEKREFYGELLRQSHKRFDEAIEWYNEEQRKYVAAHYRLVSANRRRKRAELALKKCRLALRKESANRLGFEAQADEYEKILLYVHTLVDEESFAHHDPLAVAEAERRVKEYLREHFRNIVAHQAAKTLTEDVFDCPFFGDAPSNEIKENQPK